MPRRKKPAVEPEVITDQEEVETGRYLPAISDIQSLPAPTDAVQSYLREISRYPLLTREQELAVAKAYFDHGDKSAAEKLVTSNLRFVVKIAAEYTKFGAKLIDLIGEGNVGLMHAVREFNPHKGVKLITYAVWWIRGYIQEYLLKQYSMVKIGTTATQRKLFYRLQREREKLEALGKPADIKLLSTQFGVDESEVEMMTQRLSGRDVSLNQPLDDSGRNSLIDYEESHEARADDEMIRIQNINHLQAAIKEIEPSLNDREKYILEKRVLADEPVTLQDIGDHYKITREAVRQIEARLIEKIRRTLIPTINQK